MNEILLQVNEYEVRLGSMIAVRQPSLLSISGIGSCVGLALRDTISRVSGLAHVVLPDGKESSDTCLSPGKYADTAVRVLSKRMLSAGAQLTYITAKLVGGAHILSGGGFDGAKNTESIRRELARIGIRIVAEDVGLTYGRSMKFDTGTGIITIRRFQQSDGIVELRDILVI